jgi:cephalosporin hydroxylase
MITTIYHDLENRFGQTQRPDWYADAIRILRGNTDQGIFGLYLYYLIRENPDINTVINIGTARGHSAVCAAKGISERGGYGEVHTIDILSHTETRNWHVEKQPDSDPLKDVQISAEQIISKFHNPSGKVPITFHEGTSSSILAGWEGNSPDLVFHDGEHQYDTVSEDIRLCNTISEDRPIQVFDDAVLFDDKTVYRPFADEIGRMLSKLPKIGQISSELQRYAITRTPFPGVERAIREAIESYSWTTLEIIRDSGHAPVTALFPECNEERHQITGNDIHRQTRAEGEDDQRC